MWNPLVCKVVGERRAACGCNDEKSSRGLTCIPAEGSMSSDSLIHSFDVEKPRALRNMWAVIM